MPEIPITLMLTEPTGSLVTCVGDSELGSLTCYKTGTTFTRTPRDRKGLHPFRILSTEAKELKASPTFSLSFSLQNLTKNFPLKPKKNNSSCPELFKKMFI